MLSIPDQRDERSTLFHLIRCTGEDPLESGQHIGCLSRMHKVLYPSILASRSQSMSHLEIAPMASRSPPACIHIKMANYNYPNKMQTELIHSYTLNKEGD